MTEAKNLYEIKVLGGLYVTLAILFMAGSMILESRIKTLEHHLHDAEVRFNAIESTCNARPELKALMIEPLEVQ